MMHSAKAKIGAVVIGRNEGTRLADALRSLSVIDGLIVYVDSGSTDDSLNIARQSGAIIVELDMRQNFSAARARNAGWTVLAEQGIDFVQFIDGDCCLVEGWIDVAAQFLTDNSDAAVVCGRRRERFPDASVYNRLIDKEWDTPVGDTMACGGDALIRMSALKEVGGYNPALIAGEEPDMCFRMRDKGWRIHRLDHEMTLHDAAMTRFKQWTNRARRAGFSYAEGMWLHGASPERYNVKQSLRALFWGCALPTSIAVGLFVSPSALLLSLLWPVKILRLKVNGAYWAEALFLTLGNLPEAYGILTFFQARILARRQKIIEYK